MSLSKTTTFLSSGGVNYQTATYFITRQTTPLCISAAGYEVPSENGVPAIISMDPKFGFVNQAGFYRTQSYGITSYRSATQYPAGISGSSVNGSTVRIGRVADPDDANKSAYWFRVDQTDPLTNSGYRSEFSWDAPGSRILPKVRYLTGLCVRLPDWTSVPTGDKLLIWQIHGKTDIQPWLSLNFDGSRLYLHQTWDDSYPPTNVAGDANEITTTLSWTPNTWMRFVIDFTWDETGGGVLKAYINGTSVLNYTGRLGFNEGTSPYSYLKVGVYKWSSGNVWTTTGTLSTRDMYVKGPVVFRTDTATASELDTLLTQY